MANTTWYGDGTATVAVGSRTVTGTDTGWLAEVAGLTPIKAGDKFGIHVGRPIVIEQIISDTELLLADDWPGPAQTDAPYKIELTSPTIAAVEAMRRLLASLSNGNLDSLSEISVGTDDIPIGIGPGVFSTINKAALVQGVEYDAFVANLAGRAAYNGAAAGFSVLVIDIGDGRSALYFKNSATSGDWSTPSYVTGPVGPAGVNQRGNYSAGTAYAIRDIVQYGGSTWIAKVATTGNAPPTLPTTENTQWLLFARSGTAGVADRGAYSAATAYETNDIVLDNGSTWIALQSTTGNAPPVLPTESNAYWRLFARKGTDGAGTGDVVGPIGGVVSGSFAYYLDTSGNSLGATSKLVATQHQPNDLNDPVLDLRQFGDGWLIRGRTWDNQNYSGLWFDSAGSVEFAARNANGSLLSSYRANGCSVAGPISGTAKNFVIDHPADPENYDLRHCATESPEMLVEYRGIATLVDGRAVVDVERYFGVMENTFANLWIDAWVASLQNQTSFARVMPSSVLGASFEIVCEDGSSEDVIAWHLTARRNDAYVRWSGCPFTDSDGRLIIEFEKEEHNE